MPSANAPSGAWLDDFARGLRHPLHVEIFDFWRSRCRNGHIPRRQDIDPVEIGVRVLPWIVLYDVDWTGQAPRFRFRLVGTGNVARYGRDSTGRWFEEVYSGGVLDEQIETYSDAAQNARPSLALRQLPVKNKEFIPYERILLPFAGDSDRVDTLMAVIGFSDLGSNMSPQAPIFGTPGNI
ncbi:MAG: PAS domain-containing protein [Alphaproteobacteria bacterium]|nr:PAS domain-containing protein [Alphaproteobacteria bacterium]MBU0799195.1 PAS domain-containing protein [Alphaproteobacteria bacterium]MBU0887554.1 PAS domain-containing protein [Alphaproteobacteria bacterium]MBU1814791.1 PAS domain-containing protein [Alphaproteobacteria bacterium]